MKTSTLIRGVGGLIVVGCGAVFFLNAVGLWVFAASNYEATSRLLVHVPGADGDVPNLTRAPYAAFALVLLASGAGLMLWGLRQFHLLVSRLDEEEGSIEAEPVEDRLDELERLKRRDMVTPEEYAVKRREILKDL
ncbi:MAG: hypothetical protein WDO13_16155 [Verrucomicrobiota bacterium]